MAPLLKTPEKRDQTNWELILVIVVCAVALITVLSVFIPQLRHLWITENWFITR